jgi:transcriptional regulator with XRE-family HTH domain
VGTIGDSLQRAEQATFTRKPPTTTRARTAYLVRQLKGTQPVADLLGVSQRSVERYLQGTRKHPPHDIAERLESAVKAHWQPLVRKRAARKAADSGGITIETRAQFGYIAAPGTTDEGRLRRITEHLPPAYAGRLFAAHDAGAPEADLQGIVAEGLQEVYFKDGGRRAAGLLVRFNDIDYFDVDY